VSADLMGATAYLALFLGTIVEGDVVLAGAAALVGRNVLDPFLVSAFAALGATTGDQLYFYAFRGRLRRWLDRSPRIVRRGRALTRRVRAHQVTMVFAMRFLPGLRVAISAAAAYAAVPPAVFSVVNAVSSAVWAAAVVTVIAYVGPAWLPRLGLSGWWAVIVPAIITLVGLRWLSRVEERDIEDPAASPDAARS